MWFVPPKPVPRSGAPGLLPHEVLSDKERSGLGAEGVLTLEVEREHLAKADCDIVEGERRVSAQELLIERLHVNEHDTGDAERLLLTLRQTLSAWHGHRELILQAISKLEQASPHGRPA